VPTPPADRSSAAAAKQAQRQAAFGRRDAMTPEARAKASMAICGLIQKNIPEFAEIIGGYLPIRSEVDLRPAIVALWERGKALALPCVTARQAPLTFRSWTPEGETVPGPLGTSQPPENYSIVIPDVLLMPLAGFDSRGTRLGYGAGHYDRTIPLLRALKPVRLIGLAFACQQVDRIVDEPHDVPLDLILTETGPLVPVKA
jgi:5-formyltetrahydrofolate cyclo-ligase